MDTQEDGLRPVDSVKKLSGDLAISRVGAVLPTNMGQVTELAQYMAKAGAMLPEHLRGNPGMCMGVIMDAIQWRMNPYRLATQHMVVNNVGSYMSQAITAIINQHAAIQGRLVPRYTGKGDTRQCVLEPVTVDGQTLPYESPAKGEIKPQNSPLWKTDPDQQLFYYSARAWARRYFPELLLGVYDVDEARSMRDITPAEPQKVDNFLNDEEEPAKPLDGEVQPATLNGKPITRDGVPVTAGDIPQGAVVMFDQETGEITDVEVVEEKPEPIDPAIIAKNMAKAAKGFSSLTMLEAWAEESKADIAALPDESRAAIEKLIAVRRVELGEL